MTAPYDAFASRIVASGVILDPWLEGEPRFDDGIFLLDPSQARGLLRAGADTAFVYDELVQLVLDDLAALDTHFCFSPVRRAMFELQAPLWHGVARADVFPTAEGLQITELNSDTPTGEPEALVLGMLAREDRPDLDDPCFALGAAIVRAGNSLSEALLDDKAHKLRSVAIVYPTEFTEDLSLVRLYRGLFEAAGYQVVLGSPYNLWRDDDGFVRLFETRVSLVLRHYKTDWWSERESVWLDEDLVDKSPLVEPLRTLLVAAHEKRVAIMNPFGAVLTQNKRAMAFMWERIHRFSTRSQKIIEALVPYTARLEAVHAEQLLADKDGWVLKSDYGAEGDEVIIGKNTADALWQESLRQARPGRWIAQRFFDAKTDELGRVRNHGVFIVAGEPCGIYTRVQAGPTDAHALSVPTMVSRG